MSTRITEGLRRPRVSCPWQRLAVVFSELARVSSYPLAAVRLHVAALEGTAECVSVELLKQSAATAEENVLGAPAFVSQFQKDLQTHRMKRKLQELEVLEKRRRM